MVFADYTFDVFNNGTIMFDRELTSEDLNVQDGDRYVAEIRDGRVVFVKKTLTDES